MKLLSVIPKEDLDSYIGEVCYSRAGILFVGFLNEENTFIELFAEGVNGRSHRCSGHVHRSVTLEELDLCQLKIDKS